MEAKNAIKQVGVEYIEVSQADIDSLYYNGEKSVSLFGESFNLVPKLKPYYGSKKNVKQEVAIELHSLKRVVKGGNVVVSDGVVCDSLKEFKKSYEIEKPSK